MFDFLKSKRKKTEPPPSVAPVSVTPTGAQQHNNVRRELIRVVLKDTLRLHGIPLDWIACEVISITRPPSEEELHIQLVVMKWNEQLLRYASALQHQLLLGLDRFDPTVDHSKYVVSWRFSPDCGCPFPHLPEPKFWRKSALPQADEEPVSILDRRHSRRPPKLPKLKPPPSAPQNEPPGYAPTQSAPLR
ncbi:hypothetical protein [Rhodoferax sp. UBA5149]|uniref:hypothetical protein n=1 Tax=Rhodoferax sp. UBA5149 TaxID=1947379 RepID=UPI0025F37ED1|nr:hypothetical protein [Rhodoferax sp. UBA5149]